MKVQTISRGGLCTIAALIVLTKDAPGQVAGATGRISGSVVSASDSLPIAGVSVVLVGPGKRALTTDRGSFSFDSVAVGVHGLDVQKLGHRPVTAAIKVSSDSTSAIDIRLMPVARELMEIQVRGEKILAPRHLLGVYDRAARNNGALFTAEQIQRRNPLDTKSLLDRLAGVQVNDRSVRFARCSNTPATISGIGHSGTGGKVQVYVNGSRVTGIAPEDDVNEVLRRIHPMSIELMEVYTGVARIPAEFLADACAVIAVWTKGY